MRHRAVPVSGYFFALFLIFLYGCASQATLDEHEREWIARPLTELKQEMSRPGSYASKTGWKESVYPLANGNSVYIEPFAKDCFVHWEVNPRGTIIGYRAEGSGCVQAASADNNSPRSTTAPLPSTRW
ncbi:MAG: hypothetical protein AB1805_05835 [Nitrospirota bacterium]